MQYEVKQGEDIYDVTVKLYGSVSYCVKLCEDNAINLDADISHLILTYDASIKTAVNVEFRLNSITNPPDKNYFIKEKQSIYDLAIMFGYGIERVVEFINQHSFTLDSVNIGGQTILVTKIKTKLSDFVTLNNIKFSTEPSIVDEFYVWDGVYVIWDGVYQLRAT